MKRWFAFLILFAMLCAVVPANAQNTDPYAYQVTRQQAVLFDQLKPVGRAEYWNTRENFMVQLSLQDGWTVTEIQLYAGEALPPTNKAGQPVMGKFNCVRTYASRKQQNVLIQCNLDDEMNFTWGGNRTIYVALHGEMTQIAPAGTVTTLQSRSFWMLPVNEAGVLQSYLKWPKTKWGGYFTTVLYHPQRGHFIDSPVAGITYRTPTNWGTTDASGAFDYFPGERVDLWLGPIFLGSPIADQKISPLDIFAGADLNDVRVVNMARLLQSMDADGAPQAGINITYDVTACLSAAMMEMDISEVDFSDGFLVDELINTTIAQCAGNTNVSLVAVSAEDAIANLDRSTNGNMFRKNISRTPNLISSKSKLDIMGVWFPARKADGSPTAIEYYDENGNLIRTAMDAKPIIVTYTDSVPETGAEDIFAAISRDDGKTFKRVNLSRAADKSSFTLANGQPYFGDAKKPVVQVKNNNILVAWTSKFCNSGKPAYTISLEDDYIYDDPYYQEDIWGVGGPQRSVDYTEQGFPEVGEIPFSCVWVARGTIVTQAMINSGGFWGNYQVGDIVWFKPERLTSGRRDANQIFAGGADGAGFAIVWQEDPEGLMPGSATGPGEGWSGATANHKTDIWYSYITMADFNKVDLNFVEGGDPLHDDSEIVGRPKALVPMSLPVRLSDNDIVSTDNMMVELDPVTGYPITDANGNWIRINNPDADGDGSGTHAYGYMIDGLCESFYEFVNQQGVLKKACVTADQRLLDGDTGASRPNLNLQTYTRPDGTKSAWAIVAYEETKGLGAGNPAHTGEGSYGDEYTPEEGKNVIYHTFDFRNPDKVSAGHIVNLPETDENGNPIYVTDENGNLILDFLGRPQLAYENARRPRFIMQSKSAMGPSRTVMVILYKEGQDGQGRPSDIMMRRVVVPLTDRSVDNPYRFSNFVPGAQNVSTVTPTVVTESSGDPLSDDPWGAVKVVRWQQTPADLSHRSSANPYEDARAHRGDINGDFLVIGYTYTPNWAAYRNGNDKYDFYVRRSYDGGQTWTTDPNGSGVTHCNTFTDPLTKIKTEVCNYYGPGQFEQARNVSRLPNNKMSVIEPRIVGTPGTIKNPDGSPTGKPEDINNPNVFYLSYGTANNVPTDLEDEDGEYATPMDLFYSFTTNLGESYVETAWEVNPDSTGNHAGEIVYRWASLAIGDAQQGEAQLRMTPDGSRFYATWLEEGSEGSDIHFRRIMSLLFPNNVAP
ncbi:MAG: choice-of-anchor O protein [Chloroflexota bacterium]